jgi:hypothetical protein
MQLGWAVCGCCLPAAQLVHAAAPALAKVPEAHAAHSFEPAFAAEPAAQSPHAAASVAPSMAEYRPAGHAVQSDDNQTPDAIE